MLLVPLRVLTFIHDRFTMRATVSPAFTRCRRGIIIWASAASNDEGYLIGWVKIEGSGNKSTRTTVAIAGIALISTTGSTQKGKGQDFNIASGEGVGYRITVCRSVSGYIQSNIRGAQ